jgi:elongation factor P
MIPGTEVHEGMLLLIDGKVYKAISCELRGSAQAHKIMHLGLKSIPEGHYIEKKYNPGDKVEQIFPERIHMQYLYSDETACYFMNTETYEQFPVPRAIVGNAELYMKENSVIQVEFYNGQPINVVFPKTVELKVVSSPPGLHEGTDTTLKEAVLENSQRILVPQFIKEGDIVKIDVESGKYLDRVKK